MIYNLLIAAILIVAFFMCVGAYSLGFKHGKTVRNDVIPTIKLNPVKAYTEHREEKKQVKEEQTLQSKIDEGFYNIMNYTGEPQRGGE